MAPTSVKNKHVMRFISAAKQKQNNKTTTEPRYNVVDKIRIASRKLPFRKGYLNYFSNEMFTIYAIHSHMQPPSYTFRNEQNDVFQGNYANSWWQSCLFPQKKLLTFFQLWRVDQ